MPSLQREDTGAPGRSQNEYFVAALRTRPGRIHYGQSARRSAWNSLRWHAVSREDSTFCVRVPTSLLDANSEDSFSAPSIGNAVLGHQSETQLSQPQREGCHPAWAEGEWAARGKKGCPINACVRTDKETRRRCAIMAAGPEHPKDTQQRGAWEGRGQDGRPIQSKSIARTRGKDARPLDGRRGSLGQAPRPCHRFSLCCRVQRESWGAVHLGIECR